MTAASPASALHKSPYAGVFYVTGGGVTLLTDLLTEPGASSTVLEASVPYARTSMADLLGGAPDQSCSADTARSLAMAAWQRARYLDEAAHAPEQLFGIGCTAALATNRPKRGAHRAYLAVQTSDRTVVAHIEFDKGVDGMGNRLLEEAQITELAWQLLDKTLDVRLNAKALSDKSQLTLHTTEADPAWKRLLLGVTDVESVPAELNPAKALLSGSFNPLHPGHLAMAEHAARTLGVPVDFEICVDNVDKPALGFHDLEKRCAQFANQRLWLTRRPTFIEKARAFPNCTFVVGIDTMIRIGMEKYYESRSAMTAAFEEMASLNCRFLVFGRETDDPIDEFSTLDEVSLPNTLSALCTGVPEAAFRMDVSSSELRRKASADE